MKMRRVAKQLIGRHEVELIYENTIHVYGQAHCQYGGTIIAWGGITPVGYDDWLSIRVFCTTMADPNRPFWLKIRCDASEDTSSSLPPPASGSSMVLIRGHLVIFIGHAMRFQNADRFSHPIDTECSNDIFMLNLTTLKWRKAHYDSSKLVPSPRDKSSSWAYNDLAYFFGGYGCQLKNPNEISQGDFTVSHGSEKMWNNQLLSFDINGNSWSFVPTGGSRPSPRAAASACISPSSSIVYLFGGRWQDDRLNDLHTLDMKTLLWTKIEMKESEKIIGRSWCTISVTPDDSFLYVWGGKQTGLDGEVTNEIWAGNLKDQIWLKSKEASDCRYWHSGGLLNGALYAIGGFGQDDVCPEPSIETRRVQPASLKSIAFSKIDYKNRKMYRDLGKNIEYCLALRELFNGSLSTFNYEQLSIPKLLKLANLEL